MRGLKGLREALSDLDAACGLDVRLLERVLRLFLRSDDMWTRPPGRGHALDMRASTSASGPTHDLLMRRVHALAVVRS